MPFNLLLLPLLGGYVFARFHNYSKFAHLRAEKERLLIRSAIPGFFFLVVSYIAVGLGRSYLPCSEGSIVDAVCVGRWWDGHFNGDAFRFFDVSLVAFVLGLILWAPFNIIGDLIDKKRRDKYGVSWAADFDSKYGPVWPWPMRLWRVLFCGRQTAYHSAVVEIGDPLEIMLKASKDRELDLTFTLKSGKVYVGMVVYETNPAVDLRSVGIWPLQSGYRDPITKKMYLEVNYAKIMTELMEEAKVIEKTRQYGKASLEEYKNSVLNMKSQLAAKQSKLAQVEREYYDNELKRIDELLARFNETDPKEIWAKTRQRVNDFRVVIPTAEICSVAYFDQELYERQAEETS